MLPATPHTALPDPIPMPWAARVLDRLRTFYGAHFERQWEAVPADRLTTVWAEELAGYSAPEIAAGIAACRTLKFPPTIPEFLLLCRPEMDPAVAYHEAATGMAERRAGRQGEWSHPAIYWAAVKVGSGDILANGYQVMRGRWETALRKVLAAGSWEPIPEPVPALPPPGATRLSREEAEMRLAALQGSQVLQPKEDHRRWVRHTLERAARGEPVPPFILRSAREVADQMGVRA